jgi:site-specific recombinase XerD
MAKPKPKEIEEFEPEIKEYLNLKSAKTAKTYRGAFVKFLRYYRSKHGANVTFNHFLIRIFEEFKKSPLEQDHIAEKEISGFIDYLKDKGLSNNSIRVYFAAIQNYLKYKHIIVSMSFVNVPPPVEKSENGKHEWKIEHIKQFVDAASNYRDKALILCMFQSGLAVNEICNLNYGDVKDELEAGILPLCLKLVRQKTNVKFKTFFGRDAVKYLKLYLATRKNLIPKSPLFTKQRARGGEMRITPTIIQQSFSEIAKKLDFIELEKDAYNPARPHSLRAAFNSRLFTVDETLRKFWMGHNIGAVARAYLTMPTEEMRKHYMNNEQYLKIEMTSQEEKEEKAAVAGSVTAEMKEKMKIIEHELGDMVVLEQKVASLEKLYDKFFQMKPEVVWNLMQAIEREHEDRERKEQLKQANEAWAEEDKKKPMKT